MSAKHAETIVESGKEIFIPLNKLKKSPKNARKTPHSEAAIEAYAASIAAKGILQNLVVEPELDGDGAATGFYSVTIGEGRRLAQLLRAKRKEIKKTEPIRCIVDTANDPHEISLDENVTRENMHPADQFEAFKKLADERGFGAEEIAARFGVTPHVVRQRLRLGAVSPKLMEIYRNGDLALDQLIALRSPRTMPGRKQPSSGCPLTGTPARSAACSPKPMSPPRIAARSLSAQKSIPRLVVRSCATSSPRIAAAISRTWRFLICWSWRNSGGRPTP
jgi:ParB/RepB/Spo0J family partition protein